MDSIRQALAIALLFGGIAFIYLWLGVPGAAGAASMITILVCVIGIASGYWIGFDGEADTLVTELMKWLKERRRSN